MTTPVSLRIVRALAGTGLLGASALASAHAPVLDCFVEQDKVACEAGFSDGSSPAGRKIQVRDPSGKVLTEGTLDAANRFAFAPPSGDYAVVFIGGDGHDATIHAADIAR